LAGYIPKWFNRPQTVTHPSTNRVLRSATMLIEANALPLSQNANRKVGSGIMGNGKLGNGKLGIPYCVSKMHIMLLIVI